MAGVETTSAWVASKLTLPDRIDGWRVLEIGGDAGGEAAFAERGSRAFVSLPQPTEVQDVKEGSFDLIHCSAELETDLHPLAVYAWLRKLAKPDAVVVVGSAILDDPSRSQYAEYARGAEGWRWLPGRLALRWMVECSGFDVTRWIEGPAEVGGRPVAYLQAVAVDRRPALDLARQPLNR